MTDEHSSQRAPPGRRVVEPEATTSVLMVQCSQHVIPPAITVNLTNRQAHDLGVDLDDQGTAVLTRRRLGTILTRSRSGMIDAH
jgi:hypothetical protein